MKEIVQLIPLDIINYQVVYLCPAALSKNIFKAVGISGIFCTHVV